jgi:hypothetical protein
MINFRKREWDTLKYKDDNHDHLRVERCPSSQGKRNGITLSLVDFFRYLIEQENNHKLVSIRE